MTGFLFSDIIGAIDKGWFYRRVILHAWNER